MNAITKHIPLWFKEPVSFFLQELRYQSLGFAFDHAWCSFVDLYPCSEKTRKRAYIRRQRRVATYLQKRYADMIREKAGAYTQGVYEKDFPIWMFWWSGETDAPEVVRACIENTRRMAGDHPVYVLSAQNYMDFVSLKPIVVQRLQEGNISVTHFSDILRMNLLAEYGGLWLDATIFCTRPIDGLQFEQPLFSGKNPGNDFTNVSGWNWTTYAMYGWRGNRLYSLVRDFFNQYLEDHTHFIDYFLMDHAIRLVSSECREVQQELEAIEPNNTDVYYLHRHFEEAYSEDLVTEYRESETWLYKLTWKKAYALVTEKGEETLYARWLKGNKRENTDA